MRFANIKYLILINVVFILYSSVYAKDPPFLTQKKSEWVDSIVSGLSLEEKIAQLMMITAYPNQGDAHISNLKKLVKEHKPGGILVMQGTATNTAKLINELQAVSETPLLVAIDGETGLGFRLENTMSYPYQQALGAVGNNKLLYYMGRDMGVQFKQMGIHINFAPVSDINTNPENPVINFRSFGEDKHAVAAKTWAVAKGLQDERIIPVIKHFPGHGDTNTDSHYTLPVLNHSKERLDSIELYPFRALIDSGVSGIMTAHLHVKAMDKTVTPSSLSKNVVQNYLVDSLGFNGFIVTDAMNMKGVVSPNAELQALIAGNDMVEFVPNLNKAIQSVKNGVANSMISEEEITRKCTKILALKKWCGLDNYEPLDFSQLPTKSSNFAHNATQRKLVASSLTVLRNKETLPIQNLDTLKIATVEIGSSKYSSFQETVSNYKTADHYKISKTATDKDIDALIEKLKAYNLVIGSIHGIHIYPQKKYGISQAQFNLVEKIQSTNKSVFVFFGNAYALQYFKNIEKADGLILAYQDNNLTQSLCAQLLFGAIETDARLPIKIDNRFPYGTGIDLKKNKSLRFGIPEEVGIDSKLLARKVDSIANLGIDSAAFPGCQVLIAKNGAIIFHKCYGYYTYKKKQLVHPDNIYDWASLTKITGPLPALMKLNDEGKFLVVFPLSAYWTDWKKTNKRNLKIRDILAHQGRLKVFIPLWHSTLKDNQRIRSRVFKKHPSKSYSLRVSSNLYMNKKYKAEMFNEINDSPLNSRKKYQYSGLAFYIFPSLIERLSGEDYEAYLNYNFYAPMGASTVKYNPYKYYPISRIIPTEEDDFFRNELLQGFVHDEGAAMMGGVSGNAGLFGNAIDLAKIMQMYLQKGYYGGKRYLSENVLNEFTKRQFPENENRRGLGFDKSYIDNYKNDLVDAYPAVSTSENSFGHSGYTGTFAWADPDNELLFIFLSNRVHPTRNNSKIYDLNIRTAMHQEIYNCFNSVHINH